MTETVPADIAAAIDKLAYAACQVGRAQNAGEVIRPAFEKAAQDLEAAILHHLRAYAEMKAALELQTSGGA